MKISDMKAAERAEEQEAERTDVLEIVEKFDAPSVFGAKGIAKAMVQQIRESALSLVPDATTAKGRKEIRSVAYAVARCKTTIDDKGKDMVADLKEQVNKVDAVRKFIRDELDRTKEEVLTPVTDWEARVRAVEERIERFRELADIRLGEEAGQLRRRLDHLEEIEGEEIDAMGRDDELADEANATRKIITEAIAAREKYEAEQRELEQLRKEREERERQDAERRAEEERKAREAKIREQAEARAKADAERRVAEALAKAAEERAKAEAERKRIEEAKALADEVQRKAAAPVRPAAPQVQAERRAFKREIEDSILELDGLARFVGEDREVQLAGFLADALIAGEIANVEVRG